MKKTLELIIMVVAGLVGPIWAVTHHVGTVQVHGLVELVNYLNTRQVVTALNWVWLAAGVIAWILYVMETRREIFDEENETESTYYIVKKDFDKWSIKQKVTAVIAWHLAEMGINWK